MIACTPRIEDCWNNVLKYTLVTDTYATGSCVFKPLITVLTQRFWSLSPTSESQSRPPCAVIVLATGPFTWFIPNLIIFHFSLFNCIHHLSYLEPAPQSDTDFFTPIFVHRAHLLNIINKCSCRLGIFSQEYTGPALTFSQLLAASACFQSLIFSLVGQCVFPPHPCLVHWVASSWIFMMLGRGILSLVSSIFLSLSWLQNKPTKTIY